MTRTDVALLAAAGCVACLVVGMVIGRRDAELLQTLAQSQAVQRCGDGIALIEAKTGRPVCMRPPGRLLD